MYDFVKDQVLANSIDVPDVVKMKTARQEFRDLQRKTAVEKAKRDALKPDGTLDGNKLRTSLISQGFGENADELVNAVAKERSSAAATESTDLNRDYMDLLKGLITPQEFNRRHSGQTTIMSKPSETDMDTSWMKDIPQDNVPQKQIPGNVSQNNFPVKNTEEQVSGNEIIVPGSTGKTSKGMILPEFSSYGSSQESIIKEEGPQITPQYLKSGVRAEDLLPKNADGSVGGGILSYQLPKDSTEKVRAIDAAGTLLGSTFDKNDPEVQKKIDSRMSQIAESQVPELSPVSFGSSQEYFKYMQERPSKIAKAKAELIDKFEAARSSRVSQGLTERSTATGERSQAITQKKTEQEMFPLSPETNPILRVPVTSQNLTKIEDANKAIVNFANAGRSFEDAVDAAIGKSKIDGTVNWDNVVGNLVAMGAFPSAQAAKLKLALDPSAPISKEVITNLFKGQTPVLKYRPRGASDEWIKKNVTETNTYLFNLGGKTVDISKNGLPQYDQEGKLVYKKSPVEQLRVISGKRKETPKQETAAEKRKRLSGAK